MLEEESGPSDRAANRGILSSGAQEVGDDDPRQRHAFARARRSSRPPTFERAVSVHPRYTPARRRWNAEKRCRWNNKRSRQPRWRRYLRLTEVPGGEAHEELRDPCSARSAEVCRRASVVNVFYTDHESSAS